MNHLKAMFNNRNNFNFDISRMIWVYQNFAAGKTVWNFGV